MVYKYKEHAGPVVIKTTLEGDIVEYHIVIYEDRWLYEAEIRNNYVIEHNINIAIHRAKNMESVAKFINKCKHYYVANMCLYLFTKY